MTKNLPFVIVFIATACLTSAARAYEEKNGHYFMADPAFQSVLPKLTADSWQESGTTSSSLEATEVKFDDTSSPEAIVIGAPESAASQSILLAPAPNANTGVAEPIATPVASPSQSTASALPWTPAEMPPDDAAAFPKQDKPDVPSPADKAVESLPQAHDMPTKGATTSPGFVQRDAKQELWQEWAVKFDMVERENIALHDKLRALGADGLGDIRVDAVAQIENDSLRKRIAELEKQIDDLRQQAADKNKIGGKDVIKSPSDPKSGTPQTSGY